MLFLYIFKVCEMKKCVFLQFRINYDKVESLNLEF